MRAARRFSLSASPPAPAGGVLFSDFANGLLPREWRASLQKLAQRFKPSRMLPLMKIGVLTGGGDAPGLNAVLRSIVKCAVTEYGSEIVGIFNGFGGLLSPPAVRPLSLEDVRGLISRG